MKRDCKDGVTLPLLFSSFFPSNKLKRLEPVSSFRLDLARFVSKRKRGARVSGVRVAVRRFKRLRSWEERTVHSDCEYTAKTL